MTQYREITDRIFAANDLEDRAQFRDAMDHFLVAADLAEENGDDRARRLRGRARRIAVFLAAQRRWPSFVNSNDQIETRERPGDDEIVEFAIYDTRRGLTGRLLLIVRLDRRGRLRIIERRRGAPAW